MPSLHASIIIIAYYKSICNSSIISPLAVSSPLDVNASYWIKFFSTCYNNFSHGFSKKLNDKISLNPNYFILRIAISKFTLLISGILSFSIL
jgi:hypothetical protein